VGAGRRRGPRGLRGHVAGPPLIRRATSSASHDHVSDRRDSPDMKITARGLNRSTLGRQLLLGRASLDVADAVRRVVALQAQHPASPYLALWNRLTAFDPAARRADHRRAG